MEKEGPVACRLLFVLLLTVRPGLVSPPPCVFRSWHTRGQMITGTVFALLLLKRGIVHMHIEPNG